MNLKHWAAGSRKRAKSKGKLYSHVILVYRVERVVYWRSGLVYRIVSLSLLRMDRLLDCMRADQYIKFILDIHIVPCVRFLGIEASWTFDINTSETYC